MKRYASLSSDSSAVRGKLQAALYYSRKDNREKRKAAEAPISFAGAKVGVIGSGGALPTGWVLEGASFFLVEVVSLETRNDHDTIIARISGTNSGENNQGRTIRLPTVEALPGARYELSALAEILDITSPFLEAPRSQIQSRNNGSFINTTLHNIPDSWSNFKIQHVAASTANQIYPLLWSNTVNPGNSVDVTIQFSQIRVRRTG